jgi:hypothetical protein
LWPDHTWGGPTRELAKYSGARSVWKGKELVETNEKHVASCVTLPGPPSVLQFILGEIAKTPCFTVAFTCRCAVLPVAVNHSTHEVTTATPEATATTAGSSSVTSPLTVTSHQATEVSQLATLPGTATAPALHSTAPTTCYVMGMCIDITRAIADII